MLSWRHLTYFPELILPSWWFSLHLILSIYMFYINSYIKVIIRHICLNVKRAFEIQPTQNQLEMFWLRFQSQRQSSWQQQWTEGKSYNSFFWDSGHGSLASSTWENQEVQDHLHGKSFTSHSRQITKWREGPRTRNPFQRHFPSDLIPPARLHLLQLWSLSKLVPPVGKHVFYAWGCRAISYSDYRRNFLGSK